MPRPTVIVTLLVSVAIVLAIALQPLPNLVDASQAPTRIPRATFSVTLPPIVLTLRPIRTPTPRPSVASTATPQSSARPSVPAVVARDDLYIEVIFDVPDPLGNVIDNDDRVRCPSIIAISTTESPGFPVQVDTGGNIRLITSQPGRWTVPYTITCQTGAYDSSSARVTVELLRSPPTATAVPTLTSDQVATEAAQQTATPIRTPVTSATPRPTIILRFTPTPAVTPRPTIRLIATNRPTRPVTTPTSTPRP